MNRTHASASAPGQTASSPSQHIAAHAPAASLAQHLIDQHWSQSWKTAAARGRADDAAGCAADAATPTAARLAFFTPLHYEPGYAYPLLVWLHSDGGSHRELNDVMPHVSVRNHVAVAVQGIPDDRRGGACSWRRAPADADEAAVHVRRAIDVAQQRFHIHRQRVFLAGYEHGGTMALRLGLRYPEWFAGAISLEGPMPQGHAPLLAVNRARRLPLMLAACRESHAYPWSRVAEDLRLLHAAGFALALRQYPGTHDLTTEMLADMDRWILEQFCPSACRER